MSEVARQSTVRTVIVGPILDATGVAVTDGVIADLKVSKNGAAPTAFDGSATLTHRHTGHYSLAATATDLNTVGTAQITIDDTVNAMPPKEITVIEEAVYDGIYAASANGFTGAAGSSKVAATIAAGDIANNAITLASIADGAFSAAKFASGAFDAVWSVAARLLTAGTNIVLAKGTGVTGFNDLSAAQVNSEADTALADYDAPTNAEMVARTLAAAAYATAASQTTAQNDLDLLTGADGATLATSQPNYAPAKAGDAMALTSGERTTLTAVIWNALTSGMSTVGSIGKKLADWTIGTAQTGDAYAIVNSGTHGNAALKILIDAVQSGLPQRITKNTALAGFMFTMVDATDHVTGETGLTITATRSLDGAAFGACANSATEVGNGVYKIDLAAGDLNANNVTLKFAGTGADTRIIHLVTQST